MVAPTSIAHRVSFRAVLGSLCLVAVLATASCGGSGSASGKKATSSSTTKKGATTTAKSASASKKSGGYQGAGAKAAARVTISDGFFVPKVVQVPPGGTVIFVNSEAGAHTVTPDKEGSFKAVTADQLKAAPTGVRVAFPTEGTYAYHSELGGAPGGKYSGTVIVAAPTVTVVTTTTGAPAPTTTAPAPTTTAPAATTTAKN